MRNATVRRDAELTCIRCGYNLGGHTPNAICPECAEPVWHSAARDRLQYTHSGWLRPVRRGLWLLIFSFSILSALPIVVIAAAYSPTESKAGIAAAVVIGALAAGAVLAAVFGLFLVTAPDPATPREAARRVLRALVTTLIVLALTALPTIPVPAGLYPAVHVWRALTAVLAALLLLAIPVALTLHVRGILRKGARRDSASPKHALLALGALYSAALVYGAALVEMTLTDGSSDFVATMLLVLLLLLPLAAIAVILELREAYRALIKPPAHRGPPSSAV